MKKNAKTVWQANQLVLRVTEQIKDAMRARAAKDGLSLNAWANRALARATGVKLVMAGPEAKRRVGAR